MPLPTERPTASLSGRLPKRLKLAPLKSRSDSVGSSASEEVECELRPSLSDRNPFYGICQATRQVEHGLISTPTRLEIHLSSERFPIWLLTLESVLVSSVTIRGFSSMGTA
jgi:hypothetical protein